MPGGNIALRHNEPVQVAEVAGMMKREDVSATVFGPLVGTSHSGKEEGRALDGVACANDISAGRNARTPLCDLHDHVEAIGTDP